jgi:hypothetical protein
MAIFAREIEGSVDMVSGEAIVVPAPAWRALLRSLCGPDQPPRSAPLRCLRKIFKTRIQQVEDKDGERRFFVCVTIAGKPIYRVRLGSFEGKDRLRALIFSDREVIFG